MDIIKNSEVDKENFSEIIKDKSIKTEGDKEIEAALNRIREAYKKKHGKYPE